jgi:hypothetical protein
VEGGDTRGVEHEDHAVDALGELLEHAQAKTPLLLAVGDPHVERGLVDGDLLGGKAVETGGARDRALFDGDRGARCCPAAGNDEEERRD